MDANVPARNFGATAGRLHTLRLTCILARMSTYGWPQDLVTQLTAQCRLRDQLTITTSVAAVILCVDERTVRKAIELGQIHAIQVGDKTLIPTWPLRRSLGLFDREPELAFWDDEKWDEEIAAIERLTDSPPGTIAAMADRIQAEALRQFPTAYMEQQFALMQQLKINSGGNGTQLPEETCDN